jgi:hypothetical protein
VTTGRSRSARALAVLALAILNLSVVSAPAAGQAAVRAAPAVLMSVMSVSPNVPRPTYKPRPLDVQLRLVNTTGVPMDGVQILGNRGDPLQNQRDLDASLADQAPSTAGLSIAPEGVERGKKGRLRVVPADTPTVDLPGDGAPVDLTFSTMTSQRPVFGVCLCNGNGIYPLHFRAVVQTNGATHTVGGATTYLPSFYVKGLQRVGVSWVWPLIDRPHRLAGDTVFTDDDLAASVAAGGRLSRALAVVEDVGDDVPLTLLLDPELLDELEVMETGKYTVQSGIGAAVAGRGAAAASAWLAQLNTVLRNDNDVTVQLTPYADPDFESLTQRKLTWATKLPEPMATRIEEALAGRAPQTDLAWPASARVSPKTLGQLRKTGVTGVLLGSSAVRPKVDPSGVLASVAHIRTAAGSMAVGLTSHPISQDAGAAMNASSGSVLPELIAEIAVRAAEKPRVPHVVVLRPPREVDPSPDDAAAAIRATSSSLITEPISVQAALYGDDTTPMSGRMTRLAPNRGALPPRATKIARAVVADLPAVASLLHGSAPAKPVLAALPLAVQRLESSAWRQDPDLGKMLAEQLSTQVHTVLTGVHIVVPKHSYTLASGNSPLPITVQNDLPYTVRVRVQVSTVNGLTGYTQLDDGKTYTIDPNSKAALRIASRVERPGRLQVQAQLLTPDGVALGSALGLTLHSTALGTIGIVITVVAGAVLAFALLVRLSRRVRRRRRQKAKALAKPEPATVQ